MTPANLNKRQKSQVINYRPSRADLIAARPRAALRFLAFLSVLVGCACLVLFGGLAIGDTRGLPRWKLGAAIARHWVNDPKGLVFFATLMAISVLLVVAGVMLRAGRISTGKSLHWAYVWLQLGASIALGYRAESDLAMTPAGPIAPLVALTIGALSAAYPLLLIFELGGEFEKREIQIGERP